MLRDIFVGLQLEPHQFFLSFSLNSVATVEFGLALNSLSLQSESNNGSLHHEEQLILHRAMENNENENKYSWKLNSQVVGKIFLLHVFLQPQFQP